MVKGRLAVRLFAGGGTHFGFGHRVTLLCSLSVPVGSIFRAALHPPAVLIHHTRIVLGLDITLPGSLLHPDKCRAVILFNSPPCTVETGQLILCLGVATLRQGS